MLNFYKLLDAGQSTEISVRTYDHTNPVDVDDVVFIEEVPVAKVQACSSGEAGFWTVYLDRAIKPIPMLGTLLVIGKP